MGFSSGLPLLGSVKKICSSSTIASNSTLDYHGYRFYYAAAASPYASFAATAYYTHTGGSYTDRVASSSTSDAACQKSCEHTY